MKVCRHVIFKGGFIREGRNAIISVWVITRPNKLIRSRDDPNTYYCVATFTDEAAFEYHMATDFHDRIVPDIVDCLAEEMDLSFYDIIGDPKKGLNR